MAYFNAQNGCQKCTVSGEYSYLSHCNYFPQTSNLKRTDCGFRNRIYGSHHKIDSPLLRLPIDMIADFPGGDSLHLIDLGIMKKCLLGWRDGKLGNYRCKWSAKDTSDISQLLVQIKLPREIHRAVRGLDCVGHWKGLEFRSFLYYIGIAVLKPFLPADVYEHFLTLFCAITICSSEAHAHLVDLAQTMLLHYLENYVKIYGEDFIASNVHNLNHLVDDVKRFGILSKFSAYPFESKLYQIKNMIRSGHKPLAQVAKRSSELNQLVTDDAAPNMQTPILKNAIVNSATDIETKMYARVDFENYSLSKDVANKWFLTKSNQIVMFENVAQCGETLTISGFPLRKITDFFETPIKSSHLSIFHSTCEKNIITKYDPLAIKCKMVAIPLKDKGTVFIPLLHTLL